MRKHALMFQSLVSFIPCVVFAPPIQLLDEGAVQMLRERSDDGNGNPILAAVGTLQFDGGLACTNGVALAGHMFHGRLLRLYTVL